VEDVVKSGDRVKVEVLNIDDRGRYKLRRIVPKTEEKQPQIEEKQPQIEEKKPQTEKKEPPPFEDRW